MKNPVRNETSLVLVIAVIFSGIAIPVLSGFLEPSQPPAVASVQIGDPPDDDPDAPSDETAGGDGKPLDGQAEPQEIEPAGQAKPGRSAQSPPRERRTQPAPSAPPDEAAEDDGGEAD